MGREVDRAADIEFIVNKSTIYINKVGVLFCMWESGDKTLGKCYTHAWQVLYH
jgi:hypothetical protein